MKLLETHYYLILNALQTFALPSKVASSLSGSYDHENTTEGVSTSKPSQTSGETSVKPESISKLFRRNKKSLYSVLHRSYESQADYFRKYAKELPNLGQHFFTSFGRQDKAPLTLLPIVLAEKQCQCFIRSDNDDEINKFAKTKINNKSEESFDSSQAREEVTNIDEIKNNMNITGKSSSESGDDPECNKDSEQITTNKADLDEKNVPIDLEVSDNLDDSCQSSITFIPFDRFSEFRQKSNDDNDIVDCVDCEYPIICEDMTVSNSDQNGCTSPHEGHQLVHTILPFNIEVLFNLLFSKSQFYVDFHQARKSYDLICGEWLTNEDGTKTRTVEFTIALSKLVGLKSSKITETQTLRECSKPGELYSIDVDSLHSGIPYSDTFMVVLHICLARTDDEHTMLYVHANVKYKKPTWGILKMFLEKNTYKGLSIFYSSLVQSLQNEICAPSDKA